MAAPVENPVSYMVVNQTVEHPVSSMVVNQTVLYKLSYINNGGKKLRNFYVIISFTFHLSLSEGKIFSRIRDGLGQIYCGKRSQSNINHGCAG